MVILSWKVDIQTKKKLIRGEQDSLEILELNFLFVNIFISILIEQQNEQKIEKGYVTQPNSQNLVLNYLFLTIPFFHAFLSFLE